MLSAAKDYDTADAIRTTGKRLAGSIYLGRYDGSSLIIIRRRSMKRPERRVWVLERTPEGCVVGS